MKNCKKCNKEFYPAKGLVSYCTIQCRNSRVQTKTANELRRVKAKGKKMSTSIITNELCNYGCGQVGQFILGNKKLCCSDYVSKCTEQKRKNREGLILAYKEGTRKVRLFTTEERKKSYKEKVKKAKDESFGENVLRLTDQAKRYLKEERGNSCEQCKIEKWNEKEINFEIDHIDGNAYNNCKENLRILCPNCHSQTETYRGRNRNNKLKNKTQEEVLECYKTQGNIHKTLITLKLAPKGGNYETVKKILLKNGLLDQSRFIKQ